MRCLASIALLALVASSSEFQISILSALKPHSHTQNFTCVHPCKVCLATLHLCLFTAWYSFGRKLFTRVENVHFKEWLKESIFLSNFKPKRQPHFHGTCSMQVNSVHSAEQLSCRTLSWQFRLLALGPQRMAKHLLAPVISRFFQAGGSINTKQVRHLPSRMGSHHRRT